MYQLVVPNPENRTMSSPSNSAILFIATVFLNLELIVYLDGKVEMA